MFRPLLFFFPWMPWFATPRTSSGYAWRLERPSRERWSVRRMAGLDGPLEPHQRVADEAAKEGTAKCQHRDQE